MMLDQIISLIMDLRFRFWSYPIILKDVLGSICSIVKRLHELGWDR